MGTKPHQPNQGLYETGMPGKMYVGLMTIPFPLPSKTKD